MTILMTPAKQLPLRCPCEVKAELRQIQDGFVCCAEGCPHEKEEHRFHRIDNIPVLISEQRCDTVCDAKRTSSYVKRRGGKLRQLKNLLLDSSKTTQNNCTEFLRRVKLLSNRPKILVIGAGEKGLGTEELWQDEGIEIHGVDIYASETVDAVCDAHYLPLASQNYDGVWIQAVLEHVVEPNKVVAEIHRVLRDKGIIYAETPFMQQVHEGAYDFTRFTVLGHRYLFRQFRLIDMGGNKGTGIVLAWSLRYFIWALTRSRYLFRLALGFQVLLQPLDCLTSKASLHDAASGCYFMGEKSDKIEVTHKELVGLYQGQFL